MIKKLVLTGLVITSIIGLTACKNSLDVVGDQSIKSFDSVVQQMGDKVSKDDTFGGWALQSPDDSARFLWSSDFSKTTNDVMLEINAAPFIEAGLDASKLPEGMVVGDKIIIGRELGNDELKYEDEATPTASYEQIVKLYRDSIGYHAALDHYGVDMMKGMFEWAKDMTTNDKDIVFVVDPKVFIEAGVDPANVEGWVFAKVEVMDKDNKKVEVDKFLKPFDIDGKPTK